MAPVPSELSGPARRLERALVSLRDARGFPGATAAFARTGASGVELGSVAAGSIDRQGERPMRADSRMLGGSTGKLFVAAVALQLVDEGLLTLDGLLSETLGAEPWFPRLANADELTLRHLLGHTSGLRDHVWSPVFAAAIGADIEALSKGEPGRDWRPVDLVEFVLDDEPLFAPGADFAYADTNYVLVGLAIEAVTGNDFYTELRARLLDPLELADTAPQATRKLEGLVQGHTSGVGPGGPGPGNPFALPADVLGEDGHLMNPVVEYCGGGVVSTSADLARFALAVFGGDEVVPEALREQMLAARPAPRVGPGNAYGLGVIVGRDEVGVRWGHTGWYPGYGTAVAYYPEHGLALAIQVNTDDPSQRGGFPYVWLEALAAEVLAGD